MVIYLCSIWTTLATSLPNSNVCLVFQIPKLLLLTATVFILNSRWNCHSKRWDIILPVLDLFQIHYCLSIWTGDNAKGIYSDILGCRLCKHTVHQAFSDVMQLVFGDCASKLMRALCQEVYYICYKNSSLCIWTHIISVPAFNQCLRF